jgi:hypothetical protein
MTFLAFVLILASCRPSPQKAENYYDNIILPLEDVFEKEEALISLINTEVDNPNDSSEVLSNTDTTDNAAFCKKIDMAFSNFQIQISISKNKVESLPDFDKNDNLKKTALDLLNEYDGICKKEYAELIQIVKIPEEKYSLENDNAFLELSEIIDNKIQEKTSILIKDLKLFAKKYNFEIKNDSIK